MINKETPERFVEYLCSDHGLDVPAKGKWEAGVEPQFASIFNSLILKWKDLAARYDNDAILLRGDIVYERRHAFVESGGNSNLKLSGADLSGYLFFGEDC